MVRQVGGGVPIAVVRDGSGTGRWPAWTPDGQRLVYISPRGFERVPARGGGWRDRTLARLDAGRPAPRLYLAARFRDRAGTGWKFAPGAPRERPAPWCRGIPRPQRLRIRLARLGVWP